MIASAMARRFMGLQYLPLALALAAGSGAAVAGAVREGDLILSVPLHDPEMQAATGRARAELARFFERLADPAADEGEFMLAYDIVPGKEEELVWVYRLSRSPTSVAGVLLSQPQRARASAGDRVTVAEAEIVDWAYRKGAVMQGGYTYRVLIGRMPRDESAMLREYLGW
ncbi:MAG: hypothetical protein QOI38_2922 [Sphingomonadales bacterium]|jgi:uncharacterized protein YegJ (DUF2314 family)|nr:hypothetical protein [Sphingomonadales bacterium]